MLLLLTALATALDPCSLLDAKAIAAVQGAPPKQTKASEQPDGDFTTSQCFFTLPDFVKSVSFEVVTPNAGVRAGALRERWSKLSGEEKEAGEREEEEEGRRPPRQVPGVGRGAVWVGDARVGALYVLGPTAIVRVSIGGPAEVDAKIKACAKLAKNALQHLARARRRAVKGG